MSDPTEPDVIVQFAVQCDRTTSRVSTRALAQALRNQRNEATTGAHRNCKRHAVVRRTITTTPWASK